MIDDLSKGIDLIKKVENEKAIYLLNKALKEDPNNPEIYRHLGLAYFNIGKYDFANMNWKKALELDPDHYQTWWALGNLYEIEKKKKEAKEAYQNAVKTSSKHNPEKSKRYEEWVKRIQKEE